MAMGSDAFVNQWSGIVRQGRQDRARCRWFVIPPRLWTLGPEDGHIRERLSQSALVAEMRRVDDGTALEAHQWLLCRGMTFRFGQRWRDRAN